MGGKKKYINIFGSFTELFNCYCHVITHLWKYILRSVWMNLVGKLLASWRHSGSNWCGRWSEVLCSTPRLPWGPVLSEECCDYMAVTKSLQWSLTDQLWSSSLHSRFSSVTDLYLQQGGYLCSLLCLRPRRVEALSDAFVCRLSVAYIRPKFRTERPRKTKIGTSLVTRTPLSRSKVNLLLMS